MNKTYITYVVMLLAFGAGLWAILRVGNRLRPARNIGGEWQVKWDATPAPLPERMTLAQSGRFVTATFHAPEQSRSFRLHGELGDGSRTLALQGTRPPVSLNAVLDDAGDRLTGTSAGEATAPWHATRVKDK